jgi:hypothetical protein
VGWVWRELWGIQTILVHIDDVLGSTDGAAVAVGGIIIAAIELIKNEGGAVTANVLDLSQLVVRHEVASRVTRIGGKQHLGTTGNLLGDLVGVNVVVVVLGQRNRNGCDL